VQAEQRKKLFKGIEEVIDREVSFLELVNRVFIVESVEIRKS